MPTQRTFPDGIVSGEALKSVYSKRSKSHLYETVRGKAEGSALKRKEAYELEGWTVLKPNATSFRMQKKKSKEVQLEDDVWSLMYRLGFEVLSEDAEFHFEGVGTNDRQWDIFAKDDEVVFVIECTTTRDKGPKSLTKLLERIGNARATIIQQIHAHYGKDPKLKIKFGIATHDVDWREVDIETADKIGVARITEKDVEYYNTLVKHIKHAARYQFLGRYLAGEKVPGLREEVYAMEGFTGKQRFFQFLVSPHDLLKFCFISHKGKTSIDDMQTYQRMVRPKRLEAIGEFINGGGVFPTNIVVNFKGDKLTFERRESLNELNMGKLTLPALYGSAWIIDGQHRVYGYTRSNRDPKTDKSVVSVLAYENMPVNKEIEMFIDINSEQVKVDKTIVNELIANLNIEAEDPDDRLDAIRARLVLNLSERKDSPFFARVNTISDIKTQHRCLKLTSLVQAIAEPRLMGSVRSSKGKKSWEPQYLSDPTADSAKTLKRAASILNMYFDMFRHALPAQWEAGDGDGGYICTNNGIRSLLIVLAELFKWVESESKSKVAEMSVEQIRDEIAEYVAPLTAYFHEASPDQIRTYRKGSSKGIVSENARLMQIIIHEANPGFAPDEIKKAAESRDEEGTIEARDKIDSIQQVIFDDIVRRLKETYSEGDDDWWMQGIPQSVRIATDNRYNKSGDRTRPREMHLQIEDFADIVTNSDNWDIFSETYDFHGESVRARSKKLNWLKELINFRAITHNAHKGPLQRDEVDKVRLLYGLVMKHIRGRQGVPEGMNLMVEEPESISEAA